jgi:hypothetical protein
VVGLPTRFSALFIFLSVDPLLQITFPSFPFCTLPKRFLLSGTAEDMKEKESKTISSLVLKRFLFNCQKDRSVPSS